MLRTLKNNYDHASKTSAEYVALDIVSDPIPGKRKDVSGMLSEKLFEKNSQVKYLVMAFLQSGMIACGADIFTQKMEDADPIDYSHVYSLTLVAALASGLMNAYFLKHIEHAYPGKGAKEVINKALISTFPLGGVINALYLILIPLFASTIFAAGGFHLPPFDLDFIFQGLTFSKFLTLTKVECIMFLPYHTVAFKLVHPNWRPLAQALMSGIFSIIVSAVTLGYHNVWYEVFLDFVEAPTY
mmetsp:Transcript_14117/g.20855  ORF Transcript_14117/g.20855 Transcript_14117/m.20855 type:complete len:242 (-) Transcript_14117:2284-3009(-)|eukprot:CAMPEP_0194259606 /NCGR_PEP_ID=MMETSP0158-20130606/43989_1 /TAXON_ID=33649 /ORGANISM="Thalassionema nitzschioides, Strain L26-B" /LENGTH=241 /DNA_ID=CAMNT_0038999469 /DNA_START=101 /DNA_END=826 /DNA_ORIENTATION=+